MFGDEDLPVRPKIQRIVRPENLIEIPEPEYEPKVDFGGIKDSIPEDEHITDWRASLDSVMYDRNMWEITRTKIDKVKGKHLASRSMDVLEATNGKYPGEEQVVENTRAELEEKLKKEVLNQASGLLQEAGFGGLKKGILYNAMMDHINKKIFAGKTLSDADVGDLEFVLYAMPQIRRNFTQGIIAGIIGEENASA